jgi:hypothetical protein
MHRLNLAYARDFNRRHGLRGHVQFRRYGCNRLRTNAQLLDRFAYVALNPVEARLCRAPEDWLWSSYAGAVALGTSFPFVDPSLVLGCFPGAFDPRAQLRRYVEAQRAIS